MTKSRALKITLLSLLAAAVLVLIGVAIVLVPILTHQSAGGSGQKVPDNFVSQTTAEGADGRTRMLEATTTDGEPADLSSIQPGDELHITGSGFDTSIGIYVSICAVPETPGDKPHPCLGGIPEGATQGDAQGDLGLPSAWITDDWAWKAFATQRFDDSDSGEFSFVLVVPEPVEEGADCRTTRCAITTRADHTAGSDRVQDMLLPVAFAE